jgi:hypothetical protein
VTPCRRFEILRRPLAWMPAWLGDTLPLRLVGHPPVLGSELTGIFGGLLERLGERIAVLKRSLAPWMFRYGRIGASLVKWRQFAVLQARSAS